MSFTRKFLTPYSKITVATKRKSVAISQLTIMIWMKLVMQDKK